MSKYGVFGQSLIKVAALFWHLSGSVAPMQSGCGKKELDISLHLQRCSENNRASIVLPSLLKMINGMADHLATLVLYIDGIYRHSLPYKRFFQPWLF